MERSPHLPGDITIPPNQVELVADQHGHEPYFSGRDPPEQLALNLHWGGVEPPADTAGKPSLAGMCAARRLLATAVCVLEGQQPLFDLYALLDEQTYEALKTRLRGTEPSSYLPRLRSIHAYQPADRAIEACAVVGRGPRVEALVTRLELTDRGWLGTVLARPTECSSLVGEREPQPHRTIYGAYVSNNIGGLGGTKTAANQRCDKRTD